MSDNNSPIKIDSVITQEDLDEHVKRGMRENSLYWLMGLHALALLGKTWLREEPDKANEFLEVARTTTQYRPGQLFFEQFEIDDEIIDLSLADRPKQTEIDRRSVDGMQNIMFSPFGHILQGILRQQNLMPSFVENLKMPNADTSDQSSNNMSDQSSNNGDEKVQLETGDNVYELITLGQIKQQRDSARAAVERARKDLYEMSELDDPVWGNDS